MVAYISGVDRVIELPVDRAISLEKGIANGIAAMRPIDQSNLESLLEVEDAKTLPPIEVVLIKDGYIILDGYHRYERAKAKNETKILANARTFTNDYDILNFAFSANIKHGLPSNPITRTAYALWLHITPDKQGNVLSMREAAKRAGISHAAVSKAYHKLQDSQEIRITSEDDDVTSKRTSMLAPTKKLGKSLYTYFTNEYDTFSNDMYSQKSETIRTKGLVQYFKKAKNRDQTIIMLRSLASSFNNAAIALENNS